MMEFKVGIKKDPHSLSSSWWIFTMNCRQLPCDVLWGFGISWGLRRRSGQDFTAVATVLNMGDFDSSLSFATFAQHIWSGDAMSKLHSALVIDGFTRFQGWRGIPGLMKAREIVTGTYYKPTEQLVREQSLSGQRGIFWESWLQWPGQAWLYPSCGSRRCLWRISNILESRYDFSESTVSLWGSRPPSASNLATMNQKEELRSVAKSIRQRVHDGARYMICPPAFGRCGSSYQLRFAIIFDQYQIPYYLGRSESMCSIRGPVCRIFERLKTL